LSAVGTSEAGANDGSLRRLGQRCWSLVGIAVAATIIVWIIGAMAGLVIPLVVAVVTGMLLHPVVDRLERIRCPRSAGAALVLIGLSTVVVASLWLTVVGVIDQGDEISARVTSGLEFLDQEIGARWDPIGDPETAQRSLADAIPQFLGGLSSWFGTVFSSIAAFLVGTGISAFFLYYILRDWYPLNGWMEQHLGVDPDLGSAFVADANNAIRSYFGAITLSSLVTAVAIGGTAVLLDLPLALTIGLVTFVTSYVPYLGAIFSGAFAVLIALGSTGTRDAIIMLLVILVVQNIVQTLMLTKLSSDLLNLHPIVNLASTIVGAAMAGLLGAMLSAPVVAIAIAVQQRLAAQRHAGTADLTGATDHL